ncbi:unnamed protein product [Paramecium primaurelia]|nr:unnamed protein product [Paramecium primaurelia]
MEKIKIGSKLMATPNEWSFMHHSTRQNCVNSIVKDIIVGQNNLYANDDCNDKFGNAVKVKIEFIFK